MADPARNNPGGDLRRIESIVQAVLDAPADERDAVLRNRCGGDAAMLAAAQRLLNIPDTVIDGFLARAPGQAALSSPEPVIRGPRRIGHYEILRKLGEGGMGVVYEARQENPRRIVALKVIRPILGSESMLKRFQTETNALGQLQHPGIARIYEAGTHHPDDGSAMPYFAMELVNGPPLDQYVRDRKMPLHETLGLFAHVCDAVQYAHARGVIHRDLKPGNILVQLEGADDGAQPKIIDFGVARLIASDVAATRQTNAGQVIGTLAYMSPEQVGGDARDIDARTDVYSLGVILYELVAGRAPFDLRDRSLAEALRTIREDEATRLSSIDVRLRGDIETIVGKSIEKSRERRYASASDLAADIRRYLSDRPIQARPVSTLYQLRKFARRNRGLVTGLLATGLVLIIGAAVSISLALSENRQRRRADDRAEEAARQARIATSREKEARELAYRTSLAAANAAIQAGNVALARQNVAAAPQELRGWEWRYLNYVADRSERVLGGHRGAVAFSVDRSGRRVASRDGTGVVRLWDVDTGEVLYIWPDSRADEGPAIDPAGRVVLWSGNGHTMLASAQGGEILWRADAAYQISPLAFSPTGDTFVACERFGRQVVIFDTMGGNPTTAFDSIRELFYTQFSPDGRWIAARSNLGQISLIDPPSRSVRWCAPGWSSRFSGDGEMLALWSAQNTQHFSLDLVSTSTCQPLGSRVFEGVHPQSAWDLDRSGERIAVCEPTGRVQLFDDVLDPSPAVAILAHSGGQDVRFSDDGRTIFSSGSDGEVRTWDANTCPSPLRVPSAARDWAYAGAISPDGRMICRAGWGCATVVDTGTTATLWRRYSSRAFFHSAAFNADASRLAIGGQHGELRTFDARSGDPLSSCVVPGTELIFSIVWLPDGDRLLAALNSGAISIVDPSTGATQIVGKHESPATCVAIAPGGRLAASGSGCGLPGRDFGEFTFGHDLSVRIWNIESQTELRRLGDHADAITALAFSPDGQRLASGSRDGIVLVHSLNDSDDPVRIQCGGAIESLAFSADTRRLAIAAAGSIRIHAPAGELLLALDTRDAGATHAIGFTHPDAALISTGFDTTLQIHECGSTRETQAARRIALAARSHVEALRPTLALSDEIAGAIERNAALPPALRGEALRYCRAVGNPVTRYFSDAVLAASQSNLTLSAYELALRKAEDARRVLAGDWRILPALGLLTYRVGRHAEALDVLTAAAEECRHASTERPATLLAGLALTKLALGDRVGAERDIGALRDLVSPGRGAAHDERAAALLGETEAALGSAPR